MGIETSLLISGIAAGVSAATGVAATGVSMYQQNKASHEQSRQHRQENERIAQEKADALEKRKRLIDEQRYNLLGSDSQTSNINNINSSSFNLLSNNQTLG